MKSTAVRPYTGVGVGIYTMLRLLGLGDMDGSAAEDAAVRETPSLPRPQTTSPLPISQVNHSDPNIMGQGIAAATTNSSSHHK